MGSVFCSGTLRLTAWPGDQLLIFKLEGNLPATGLKPPTVRSRFHFWTEEYFSFPHAKRWAVLFLSVCVRACLSVTKTSHQSQD